MVDLQDRMMILKLFSKKLMGQKYWKKNEKRKEKNKEKGMC
jgi:hypothetical protein